MRKDMFYMEEADFKEHPVWSWWDDDSNDVEPVEYQPHLPEDHDALFIYSSVIFNDGLPGNIVLSVRPVDQKIYLITFFNDEGEKMQFSFQKALFSLSQKRKLQSFIGKDVFDIFPIRFTTPFMFADGNRLEGEIRLEEI